MAITRLYHVLLSRYHSLESGHSYIMTVTYVIVAVFATLCLRSGQIVRSVQLFSHHYLQHLAVLQEPLRGERLLGKHFYNDDALLL